MTERLSTRWMSAVAAALMLAMAPAARAEMHFWRGELNTNDDAGVSACHAPDGSSPCFAERDQAASSHAFDFGTGGTCASYLVCDGAPLDFGTSDFMVSFFMKTQQASGTAPLLSTRAGCPNHENFWEIVLHEGSLWFALDGGPDGTNYGHWSSPAEVADGRWHDITLLRKAGTPALYIDGIEQALTTWAGGAGTADVSGGNPAHIATSPCVGMNTWFGVEQNFVGQLDDIKVFRN